MGTIQYLGTQTFHLHILVIFRKFYVLLMYPVYHQASKVLLFILVLYLHEI